LQYQFNITTNYLQDNLFLNKGITLSVLRLDQVHTVISGNKIFKLNYLLEDAIKSGYDRILTFGGAYSNHLVASAYACKLKGLRSIGVVRGEQPFNISHTLKDCLNYGMHLHYISREKYDKKDEPALIQELLTLYGNCSIIPEGGFHSLGAKGAADIMNYISDSASHIACAVGTATTLAGLLKGIKNHQQVIAIPVLKGMTDIPERLLFLNGIKYSADQLHIADKYHFGGYAKKDLQLFERMNEWYAKFQIPTDFVYTAKMMYGIMDMIQHDFFAEGSHIVCVHTGGLQGNLSLRKGILTYN
jgi:1-aminocyclopropane-1-carboxylate deaminase/D-cysteine desulfhydrase-like pyridoxal-dependent ACC family enzyme